MEAFMKTLLQPRDYSPKKDFLRICWIESEDREAFYWRESAEVQEPPSYKDWLAIAGGHTVLGEPRISTPGSVSEDLESSTCPPPSVQTSVLAYRSSDVTTSLRPGSTSSRCTLPPYSPVPWKSGCTPPPDWKPRECREPGRLCRTHDRCQWEARKHWQPSPMLLYYIWEQQQPPRPLTQLRGVEEWLRHHEHRDGDGPLPPS
ncbi:hypothetical protein V5799_020585 [Amblyomma americanum]|uniref:Uncharacterized protein n=1 Tax=Amblyomma americanum TaxID=6943 RepID=A0AAQ4ETG8_AMBAM